MQQQVLAAAAQLVDAFARHDTAAYFAAFAPEASFVFHTSAQRLDSRAAYQALWQQWERDYGFRVQRCNSSQQQVQLLGEVAIFTHHVDTVIAGFEGEQQLQERETIVFQRQADGAWLAVHEHLSPLPAA
ncbi:nuclear transport factor 2 family protein [Vogesella sp. LIG4]|uniref:YybH family protein n=1 Tax=Vogesella sp. LIG4 TaxID=1192162 RepID=UPI00081FA973|nr:nuclear transport factor 2 family protein [Vogesella sp. LIG4]SCK22581.1 conserved hypothetical protein [Vogesella sp. LIG4]